MIKLTRAVLGAFHSRALQVATVAIGLVALAGTAQAATVSVTCTSTNTTTYTLSNAVSGQCFSGNFNNTIDSSTNMLGQTGWTLSDLSNESGGSGVVNFSPAPIGNAESGTWGLDSFSGYSLIAVILKAGNTFAAFLIDTSVLPTSPTSTWSTSRGLSHAGIYTTGVPSAVPLPAAVYLFGTALAGLGVLARRRRAA